MNPYFFTLIFLLLMSLLTSSEVVRFSQHHLGSKLHGHSLESLAAAEELRAFAAIEDFRALPGEEVKEEKEKKTTPSKSSNSTRRPSPLKIKLSRPPNNSRLNLYLILHASDHKDYPSSRYEVLARLIRSLYGKKTFFEALPDAEYRLLDTLIALKEETEEFIFPDELSTLDLGDETLQQIFYHMLKGSDEAPSLLNYITFDNNCKKGDEEKVNLMFASLSLIEAIIDSPQVCEQILRLREKAWEEILDQEAHRLELTVDDSKNRTDFKRELEAGLQKILCEAQLDFKQYKWAFDLTLGKMGNILFIEDPHTGIVHREKYSKR